MRPRPAAITPIAVLFALLATLLFAPCSYAQISSSSFGMHLMSPQSQISVPYGRCRLWGTRGAYWADIEPSPGVYNFTALDAALATAKQNGIDDGCVFTFGYFPQWASSKPSDNTCDGLTTGTGSCWPPTDLNFEGSGSD